MKTTKKLFGILTIAAMFQIQAHAQDQTFITNGLVAYYPFNGNANDASGNGLNGVPFGGTFSTDRFGIANQCLNLDSDFGEYVAVPNNNLLNITNDLTISAWIKFYELPSFSTYYNIVTKRSSSDFNNFPYYLGINFQPGIPTDYDVVAFTTARTNSYQYLESSNRFLVPTNQWVQITSVITNNFLTIYMNGTIIGTNAIAPNSRYGNTANLLIGSGARTDIPAEYCNGNLDDIRIYNRALAANEVAQLYALEAGPVINIQKAVYLTSSNLWSGSNYQAQASSNLSDWTNFGAVFTATNSYWHSTNYFDTDNTNRLFFRLQVVP